ncbi:BMP family ABC transporter substrate-binding protein [Mucilaginibacter sp. HD30]
MKTFKFSYWAMALLALVLVSCGPSGQKKNTADDKKLKVAFITVGPANDWGYNYSHNEGRLYMEKTAPDLVQTTIVEKVPESAEVERVMERLIADGNKLIFPTSYGYLEPALRVAAKHPDVVFMHCGGFKNSTNLGTYFAYIHEPMYLSGIAAGKMTKTNILGFVASFPIPQVLRNINAFTLGARSVNPKATVHVIWTSSWSDPAIEAESTKKLIAAGADVLSMHEDSPITVVQTAEKAGVMSVGYHADVSSFAPNGWITGARWNWGKLYLDIAKAVANGTWKTSQIRTGIASGYVDLSAFGKNVPKNVQDEVLAAKQQMIAGKLAVFQAPLKDRGGNIRLKPGQEVTFAWMESMNYFVDGVVGSIPSK